MNFSFHRMLLFLIASLAMTLSLAGCGISDSTNSSGPNTSFFGTDGSSALSAGAIGSGAGGPQGAVSPGNGTPVVFQPTSQNALQSIMATPNPLDLTVTASHQLSVTGTLRGGGSVSVIASDHVTINYLSNNLAIATVTPTGLVTGVGTGTTTVSVTVTTSANQTLSTSVAVGVSNIIAPPVSFALYVTESPGGPANGNTTNWGGVLGFLLTGDAGNVQPGQGIPANQLQDPVDLTYRSSSSEVFVSNRHGNNSADGVPGSVSRFLYDSATRTFTTHGSFATLSPCHQLTFNPVSGELFVAAVGSEFGFVGGIERFLFDTNGSSIPNGSLNIGTVRGVAISPDGKRLYATQASNVIRQFDLVSGLELANVTESGGQNFHFMSIRNGELYVPALNGAAIYRYTIAANDDLIFKDTIPASSPISVAFSPDGLEMYASGHISSSVIERFTLDAVQDRWVQTTTITSGVPSLGGLLILPSHGNLFPAEAERGEFASPKNLFASR